MRTGTKLVNKATGRKYIQRAVTPGYHRHKIREFMDYSVKSFSAAEVEAINKARNAGAS